MTIIIIGKISLYAIRISGRKPSGMLRVSPGKSEKSNNEESGCKIADANDVETDRSRRQAVDDHRHIKLLVT